MSDQAPIPYLEAGKLAKSVIWLSQLLVDMTADYPPANDDARNLRADMRKLVAEVGYDADALVRLVDREMAESRMASATSRTPSTTTSLVG